MVADVVLDLASDVFDALDHIEDMTYTPATGSPSSVRVAVSLGIQRLGFESNISSPHDEASFLKSSITNPRRGDKLDDGTNKYELISPIFDDGVTATWLISKL